MEKVSFSRERAIQIFPIYVLLLVVAFLSIIFLLISILLLLYGNWDEYFGDPTNFWGVWFGPLFTLLFALSFLMWFISSNNRFVMVEDDHLHFTKKNGKVLYSYEKADYYKIVYCKTLVANNEYWENRFREPRFTPFGYWKRDMFYLHLKSPITNFADLYNKRPESYSLFGFKVSDPEKLVNMMVESDLPLEIR